MENHNPAHISNSRREFLKKGGLALALMGMPFSALPAGLRDIGMGVVVHSYWSRWKAETSSPEFPGFNDAMELLRHCHSIGAGGIQVGVKGWETSFAKSIRDEREKLGLYLEGSISLPKSMDEVQSFEMDVKAAKEAGAKVLRTACLSGRRYETFGTREEYLKFKSEAIGSIKRAEPIVRKHKMRLAVENHKDWFSQELVEIIESIGSEWVGVTLDFGNNVSLLEHPMDVIRNLAPISFSTHVKDMAVKEYEDGFLLSEVPLGEGIVDLDEAVRLCKKGNKDINFSLEMITRDPLKIPCKEDKYWMTFDDIPRSQMDESLKLVREESYQKPLPKLEGLSVEEKFRNEENNILSSLDYSKNVL